MAIKTPTKEQIKRLRLEYEKLRGQSQSLLTILDEAEIPEGVYNSNAIENSTLTLQETEKILLEIELSRHVTLREVHEAKNLARVTEYIRTKSQEAELDLGLIKLLHKMLLGNINDDIAGRFRQQHEYVRVGTHIAPAPEHVERLLEDALALYASDHNSFTIERIARFHLEFERIHPFCDGNGRIGRIIINYQLMRQGFVPIIVRNKEKQAYYKCFKDYEQGSKTVRMERELSLALIESLHKRLANLRGQNIIRLANYAKDTKQSVHTMLNAARRQTIQAFREKGIWKIGEIKSKDFEIIDHSQGFKPFSDRGGAVATFIVKKDHFLAGFSFAVSVLGRAKVPSVSDENLLKLAKEKLMSYLLSGRVEFLEEYTFKYDPVSHEFIEVANPDWWIKSPLVEGRIG